MVKDGAKILNHHLLFWKFGVSTPCIIFCRVHYLYSALTKKKFANASRFSYWLLIVSSKDIWLEYKIYASNCNWNIVTIRSCQIFNAFHSCGRNHSWNTELRIRCRVKCMVKVLRKSEEGWREKIWGIFRLHY